MKRTRLPVLAAGIVFSASAITWLALFLGSLGYADGLFASYFKNPLTLAFNFLPVALSITLLMIILQSLRLSVFFNGVFWCALALANTTKISLRHATLKPEDISLIGPSLKILPHYIREIDGRMLLAALGGLIFLGAFARLMPKLTVSLRARLLVAVLFSVLTVLSVNTLYADDDLYREQYDLNQKEWCDSSGITYRLHADRYQANGFVYSFCYYSHFNLGPSQEKYDANNAKALFERFGERPLPEDKRVHVVVLLLESFKDFSAEALPTGLVPAADPYAPWHDLQRNAYHGTLIADVYGGGTITTETSVLSGLYKPPNYTHQSGAGVVRTMHDNGYYTLAMHPNDGYFYSRHERFPNQGFVNFLYTQNHFHNDLTAFHSDDLLFPDVKAQFDRFRNEGPVFIYAATMQNHGPYNCDHLEGREWFPYEEGMARRAYYMLNNYFDGCHNTTLALRGMLDAFAAEEEPVVVVAFGDHSPRVEPGGYEILGLDATEESDEAIQSRLNQYATPYIIWGNDAAKTVIGKDFQGQAPTIDPEQLLSGVLFNYLGWHGNANDAYMQTLTDHIGVQKGDFFALDGHYTTTIGDNDVRLLNNLSDLNIFYRKQKLPAITRRDELARPDAPGDIPAEADPDSTSNAGSGAKGRKSSER